MNPMEMTTEFLVVSSTNVVNSTNVQHHFTIARIRDWKSEPYFGGWTEAATGKMYDTGSGCMICRRLAHHSDIVGLVRLWDSRIQILEWINDTEHRGCIPREVTDEIKAAIASEGM